MQQVEEAVGEVLGPPGRGQPAGLVAGEGGVVAVVDTADQPVREVGRVGDREVEALGAGRRQEVRGVPREEDGARAQPAPDPAAHPEHAGLAQPYGGGVPGAGGEPERELFPYAALGPVGRVVVGGDLEIEPGDVPGARHPPREPGLVDGVEHALDGVGHVGEDGEPVVGVTPLQGKGVGQTPGDDAVHAVAADHELGAHGASFEPQRRTVQLPYGRVEMDRTAHPLQRRDEVADQQLLGIHPVLIPPGQLPVVDAGPFTEAQEVAPPVPLPLLEQPVGETVRSEEVDDPMLQHPRPGPLFDVPSAPALPHLDVDPGPVQQRGEHQPGGPRTDDRDAARAHRRPAGTTAGLNSSEITANGRSPCHRRYALYAAGSPHGPQDRSPASSRERR
ncbi:hypothetical protein Saa2_02038 [Streptomyces acidiscabies]|nr:hypothetical protein Saa2_02038 [Streptomyces acidiscabies]